MKRLFFLLILSALFTALPLAAQDHSVTLTWTDPQFTPADLARPGVGWNVFSAQGACSGSSSFTKLTPTPTTVKTYKHTGLSVGRLCYRITAIADGLESPPSNTAQANIAPNPPGQPTIAVDIALTLHPDGTITAKLFVDGKPVDYSDVPQEFRP